MDLLRFTPKGIYCPQAGVYLDPWRPVEKAIISHAHSDHARSGHRQYLAPSDSEAILKHRLGKGINLQSLNYGEAITINGVRFSFHPAGHIIGSAQIRVEHKGQVWVFTGDYKLENDSFSAPFEPVPCNVFISESTFGLPVYRWKKQAEIFSEINSWWSVNAQNNVCSVISAYSLGKAQRILCNIDRSIGPVYSHPTIYATHEALRSSGFVLPSDNKLEAKTDKSLLSKALIILPPMALSESVLRKIGPYSLAIASGWAHVRGNRRRQAADRGFALSDHADWDALNEAVLQSRAERVILTHGFSDVFAGWLNHKGIQAEAAKTDFSVEGDV
ncbi:MAG: ligase-associated DNA damage response exonuclease [Bacteroidia bacterium]